MEKVGGGAMQMTIKIKLKEPCCQSCGKPWSTHSGCESVCAAYQEFYHKWLTLKKKYEALKKKRQKMAANDSNAKAWRNWMCK